MKLLCGCCGKTFKTWKGYKDQDQDKGYGTCLSCQETVRKKNEQQWLDLEKKVAESLSAKNREKFLSFEMEVRRGMILKMIDEGLISWRIR